MGKLLCLWHKKTTLATCLNHNLLAGALLLISVSHQFMPPQLLMGKTLLLWLSATDRVIALTSQITLSQADTNVIFLFLWTCKMNFILSYSFLKISSLGKHSISQICNLSVSIPFLNGHTLLLLGCSSCQQVNKFWHMLKINQSEKFSF